MMRKMNAKNLASISTTIATDTTTTFATNLIATTDVIVIINVTTMIASATEKKKTKMTATMIIKLVVDVDVASLVVAGNSTDSSSYPLHRIPYKYLASVGEIFYYATKKMTLRSSS